jgi:hypothetical protein
MSLEIEAVGDIITGGLAARAVEPEAGEGEKSDTGNCLNCHAALHGAHCHNCGQKAKVHRTLAAFGHDFLHGVLHFDGKIWRTLPMLVWNPGHLTRRYIHGERAKFVSPLALFLFSVFLTFATFSKLIPTSFEERAPVSASKAQEQLQIDRKEIVDAITELQTEKKQAITDGDPPGSYAWIDGQVKRNQKALQKLDTETLPELRRTSIAERRLAVEKQKEDIVIARLEAQIAAAKSAGQPTAQLEENLESERTGAKLLQNASALIRSGKTNTSDINFSIFGNKKWADAAKHAVENPQLLIYKAQSNAYKYSWALIPISVPFVWLLFFWRRQFKMFDHVVFVTYSLCFMMFLIPASALLITFPATPVAGGLLLIFGPSIHMYRQIKQAYGVSRFGAIWRTAALATFAAFALTLFVTMIFMLGITG